MIQIKGSTIKSRLDFARARGGEALLAKLRATPGIVGECASATMLALRTFPLHADQALCEAIRAEMGAGESLFEEMGAFSADEHRNLQNIVHGRKTDPHEILGGIPRQFPQYLLGEFGGARYERDGERAGRVVWEGHRETCRAHCRSSIGYTVRLLENCGVTGVSGRDEQCLLDGDPRCAWRFAWKSVSHLRLSAKLAAVRPVA